MIVHTFRQYYKKATYSDLQIIDGKDMIFSCKILERPWDDNKQGVSCIPANGYFYKDIKLGNDKELSLAGGTAQAPKSYRLVWEYSNKFNTNLWEIYEVPNRSECKFHTANYVFQLQGCLAPGTDIVDIDGDSIPDVSNSVNTLGIFNDKLPQDQEHKLIISHLDYPKDVQAT